MSTGNKWKVGGIEVIPQTDGSAVNNIKLKNLLNTHGVSLESPSGLTADYRAVMPVSDGPSGYVMKTNGSGQWFFAPTAPSAVTTRTLVLSDTTVGAQIAPAVPVQAIGTGVPISFTCVLRVAITATLTVRVNHNGVPLCVLSVPATTPINTIVVGSTFSVSPLVLNAVLTWDVLASDGSISANGIASFTLAWG